MKSRTVVYMASWVAIALGSVWAIRMMEDYSDDGSSAVALIALGVIGIWLVAILDRDNTKL